ncbi:GntR family transcriptional regulator [Actinomadura terrae]|uniref:GntR family transcriptional regulator n=1 Tax=Actinomadura terrae TaxID=604353 RepID=UPI001FA736FC|nr:GntR family transcriptional regulator [Actinomadura terrae]
MTERDGRPRYARVAQEIREEILAGGLRPGGLLPSEADLADRFGVSPTGVRNGIRRLRERGLVGAEQGRGFVRAPRQRLRRHHSERYQWEKDRARQTAEVRARTGATEFDTDLQSTDLKFHAEYSETAACSELAMRFDVPVGTRMLQRDYSTSCREDDAALSVVHSYLVYDVVATNPELLDVAREPYPGGTQSQLFTIGIEVDRIVDELSARPALPEEAGVLGIEVGASVLVLNKTSIDVTDRVVEYSEVILPGEWTEVVYTTELKRW